MSSWSSYSKGLPDEKDELESEEAARETAGEKRTSSSSKIDVVADVGVETRKGVVEGEGKATSRRR